MTLARKTSLALLGGLAAVAAITALPRLLSRESLPQRAMSKEVPPPAAQAKVLFVDSYHEGYPWSDSILDGALKTLNIRRCGGGELDCSRSSVILQVFHMDTKRNQSEAFKREAGLKVKALIESWKPDVVICSDDNATAYVTVPYFRNGPIPFVFCGINWDASEYDLPRKNVTGMLEVAFFPNLMAVLDRFARGPRVGVLGACNETNVKEFLYYRKQLGERVQQEVLVDTFGEWKAAYLTLQDEVDVLILAPPSFLSSEQDKAEARQFVLDHAAIPSGSIEDWIAPYSLICQAKLGSEQGEWAARAALRILSGASPAEIPVASNHLSQIYLNMPLARKLHIVFPVDLVEQATFVGAN